MMIYRLKVALFRSPCPNQREELSQDLLDWGRERGVEGVCMSGAHLWHQARRRGYWSVGRKLALRYVKKQQSHSAPWLTLLVWLHPLQVISRYRYI